MMKHIFPTRAYFSVQEYLTLVIHIWLKHHTGLYIKQSGSVSQNYNKKLVNSFLYRAYLVVSSRQTVRKTSEN